MTRALMHNTQTAVILSLSVVSVTDTGPQVVTLPLANLTPILFALASGWQLANRQTVTTARLAARLTYTVDGWLKTLVKNPGQKPWLKTCNAFFPAFSWGIG